MEREGRKGISGMYYDMKVGEMNRTDLASWQTEVETGAFGDKISGTNGTNDKPLALRQKEMSGVIFGFLCGIRGLQSDIRGRDFTAFYVERGTSNN